MVLKDLFDGLPRGVREDVVDVVAQPHELARLVVDVACSAARAAARVVQHDACVWQHDALALQTPSLYLTDSRIGRRPCRFKCISVSVGDG